MRVHPAVPPAFLLLLLLLRHGTCTTKPLHLHLHLLTAADTLHCHRHHRRDVPGISSGTHPLVVKYRPSKRALGKATEALGASASQGDLAAAGRAAGLEEARARSRLRGLKGSSDELMDDGELSSDVEGYDEDAADVPEGKPCRWVVQPGGGLVVPCGGTGCVGGV